MTMQYLFTERAHLMCPHMNFGIGMSVRVPYEEERIRKTLEQLSAAHPFRKQVPVPGRQFAVFAQHIRIARVRDRPVLQL